MGPPRKPPLGPPCPPCWWRKASAMLDRKTSMYLQHTVVVKNTNSYNYFDRETQSCKGYFDSISIKVSTGELNAPPIQNLQENFAIKEIHVTKKIKSAYSFCKGIISLQMYQNRFLCKRYTKQKNAIFAHKNNRFLREPRSKIFGFLFWEN